jgi:hypothetical protein
LLRVTVPELAAGALLEAALELAALELELELELELPQAARYSAMPAPVVVVMKPRRVVRLCSSDMSALLVPAAGFCKKLDLTTIQFVFWAVKTLTHS